MKNRNLVSRIITAFVAGAVAVTAIVLSAYGHWFFCFLISMLGLWEFLRAAGVKRLGSRLVTMGVGAGFWIIRVLVLSGLLERSLSLKFYPLLGLILLPLLALTALYQRRIEDPMREIGVICLAFLYVYLPFQMFFGMSLVDTPLEEQQYLWQIPIGVLLLIWTLDSMAYFTGRFIGKHPLFPRISPNKTWEGAVGGSLSCLALGYGLDLWLTEPTCSWIVVALIVALFGQWGDLVESMFKRSVKLKDSGNILPGHGGILDRFDSLIFAIPFIFLYFALL